MRCVNISKQSNSLISASAIIKVLLSMFENQILHKQMRDSDLVYVLNAYQSGAFRTMPILRIIYTNC